MQTNPAAEQSKIIRWSERPWNQSSRKGKGLWSSDNLPSYLQTNTTAQMLYIGGKGGGNEHRNCHTAMVYIGENGNKLSDRRYLLLCLRKLLLLTCVCHHGLR